jgi:hypothetical protein
MLSESESKFEPDLDSDLSWLALRYVAGEMGHDEAEAFECRLDHDQSAREAVAEAVLLAGAIARLEPAPAPVLPIRRRVYVATLAGIVGVAAAACLAWLMVGWQGRGPVTPTPVTANQDGAGVGANTPTESVLLAWSKLRLEGAADEGQPRNDLLVWNDEAPVPPDVESTAADEPENTSDPGLPAWLLDAASLAGRPEHETEPGL